MSAGRTTTDVYYDGDLYNLPSKTVDNGAINDVPHSRVALNQHLTTGHVRDCCSGAPTCLLGQQFDHYQQSWGAGLSRTEPIAAIVTAASDELDLRDPAATAEFVRMTRPDVAIIAAAKVGGIEANRSAQGEFLYDNLMIAANTIEASRVSGVQKVVMLGSSCIYPRDAAQPMHEDSLLTGPLEPTNEGYAIAKIAALELAKMYRRQYGLDAIALMPTNLYGPGDNYGSPVINVGGVMVGGVGGSGLWGC